jgi:hypothetical protein
LPVRRDLPRPPGIVDHGDRGGSVRISEPDRGFDDQLQRVAGVVGRMKALDLGPNDLAHALPRGSPMRI